MTLYSVTDASDLNIVYAQADTREEALEQTKAFFAQRKSDDLDWYNGEIDLTIVCYGDGDKEMFENVRMEY